MPLTPADVHNVAFKKPAIGKRGYDEEEVDAFLDEVERELARLIDENNELRASLGPGQELAGDSADRLQAEVAAMRARMERALREKAAAEQAATQTQAELEQARNQAGVAASPLALPSSQPPRVLMMAQRTADEHVNDARREAEDILAEARDRAEQTVQEAVDRADAVDREARERHQQAVQSLGQKRSDMLREINGLTGLAEDYRQRLREALANHLLDLEAVPPAALER
ncbi:DivIVA domain-containing protein [Actinoplanes sp. N902-109]|uniref:DivIVA domain-containing protein n=1 Tax=Actinoplanes sp. (strain N902-109) TaxID=649831 RepID=UPI0003294CBB|nr:DivIVA domain-containing protein [Actinoplanes sp. N902-109]AGL17208.1 DivIVA family protein [Actinoplanes sp. N902-109]